MYCLVNSWHMCMVSTKCLNMCHHYISHFFHKYSINSKGICTSKIKSMRYPFDWITSTKNNILTWITDLNLIVSTFLGQSYRPLAEKIKNSQSGGSPALSPLCYTNYCSVAIPDRMHLNYVDCIGTISVFWSMTLLSHLNSLEHSIYCSKAYTKIAKNLLCENWQ